MTRSRLLAFLLLSSRAFAGPMGSVDPHAISPTGFPGAYLGTISRSLAVDPLYGSRFLDAVQVHLRTLTGMTAPQAAAGYLELAATGGQGMRGLRASLGREALDPPKAAALLIANALTRPEQFREVMDGLETLKPGMGRHSSDILREASGTGDRRMIAALRAAGARRPQGEALTYGPDGRFDTLFDGLAAGGRDGVVLTEAVAPPPTYTGYGPDGRPRGTGLSKARP